MAQIPYLDVQKLSKRFGAQVLFDEISFSIAEGQHVGLIAKNGTGKSTLLSILTGREGYESGSIVYRNDLRVSCLEQSPKFNPEESVLDACFNHKGDPDKVLKAKQILTTLKITDLNQPMGQLSGGQQKRVALANVLILEPDLLILDEPTNHLDLEMIVWLEGFLARGNKTLLMVTHDRYFLDNVCNIILELDNHTIYTYRGNYSFYLEKRQERIANTRRNCTGKHPLPNRVRVDAQAAAGTRTQGALSRRSLLRTAGKGTATHRREANPPESIERLHRQQDI